jgi:hypothetical protein
MKLLFTSGTARGGTNFRTLILNNHPHMRMSLDPFIPLFRFYRDSLLRSVGAEQLLERLPSGVLDDYYFSETKLKIMQAIRAADPDIPFDRSQWERLKPAIASRMSLASMNLIPHLDLLPADTFREVFRNTGRVIAATTDKDLAWVGFNDNWAMEFIPVLARLLPDAKFMLHLRDPRAVVNSSEFAEPDPAKRPTIVSFARHLRKYYAFAAVLPSDPALQGRLLVTRYEPFIADVERETRRMTDFLGVDFVPAMTDVTSFRRADGRPWPSDAAIYKESAGVWRREMPRAMAELTEFVCDPEMRLHGYQPEIFDPSAGLSPSALAFAVENDRDCLGWRTDFPEIERTLGGEFFRQRFLAGPVEAPARLIERLFLFPEVFEQVRAASRGPSAVR